MNKIAHLINFSQINTINLSGRGGKESLIEKMFNSHLKIKQINNPLYDFEISYEGKEYKIEVKKQEKHQWFDVAKYYNLSEEQKKIIMLYIMHKSGVINKLIAIPLGDFLDVCLSDDDLKKYGWTNDVFQIANELKIKHPALQFKVKADLNKFFDLYRNKFEIVYEI